MAGAAAAYGLESFERETFLRERWRYRPGEHVTIIGPTGSGKSHLTWQLLEYTAKPTLPALYLVKKPKDDLIRARGRELDYRTVTGWPAPPTIGRKPTGWLVWPRTQFDPTTDHPHKEAVFRRALLDSYKRGGRIVVADDTYGLAEILGLKRELIELWTEGRSMGTGLWACFQRPSYVPPWAYGQAEHLVLFNDPDKRSRDRFGEIGGVDPDLVRDVVHDLDTHQCLYLRRDGRAACVVNP